uniref:FAD/NAD(P)-binding domain-containing protein n=1 Tax=Micromonas pusilla TaxID=38833 RepID=A0A7R9Y1S2_MICPS
MSAIAKKIVLVGGGNAAGYFARAVVAAGRGAELTMIAAENVLPYERPALTKAFLHAESPARLPGFHTSVGGGGERQTAEWYATHGVEVILGTRVVDANLEEKTVVTDAGKSYSYDKLVVAIGCTALKLPSAIGGDLPGVHRVRDVADAVHAREVAADRARELQRGAADRDDELIVRVRLPRVGDDGLFFEVRVHDARP